MKKLILALAFLPLLAVAQTSGTLAVTDNVSKKEVESKDGMKFEHGSWTEILAKAKAENKYIFVDCFTTWCGPCKHMDANIYPSKEAGDFYNGKFLSVKVQFDSTGNDNEEVVKWRKDMKEIEKKYGIAAYPTYLIFDPNGQVVSRMVGATKEPKEFVVRGQESLLPEKQYYTQLRKYESEPANGEMAAKMAAWASETYDMVTAARISSEYIAKMTDPFTKENIAFIDKFTSKSSDKGFALMLDNQDKFDAALGKWKAEGKIKNIIYSEQAVPVLRKLLAKGNTDPFDHAALVQKISAKYPVFAEEVADRTRLIFLQNRKNWTDYTAAVGSFMAKYGAKATPAELNSYAWTVFDNCKDIACVNLALGWSQQSIKDEKLPGVFQYMDTYANILHRLGRTKEAIEWQEKALALAPAAAKETYTATLNKMKNGEKTWAVAED